MFPFSSAGPGRKFAKGYMICHKNICLKRISNLETLRAKAILPELLAQIFARLTKAYGENNIQSPQQVFNINELGFSVRAICHAIINVVFDAKGHSNSTELNWAAIPQHITIIPVVSAKGRAWRLVIVMLGKRVDYRTLADDTVQTPYCYLPEISHTFYREPAGVDRNIFLALEKAFVE